MTRRTETIAASYFEDLYASDLDPWRFASSDYEAEKYAATMAALPIANYHRALEIGCSIGVLTQQLAARCQTLVALDAAEAALSQARERCRDLPDVSFSRALVPADWSIGAFDLILLSEVVYYLAATDVERLVDRVEASTREGADIVLVHWLGLTDYPLSGDEAAGEHAPGNQNPEAKPVQPPHLMHTGERIRMVSKCRAETSHARVGVRPHSSPWFRRPAASQMWLFRRSAASRFRPTPTRAWLGGNAMR